MRVKFLHQVNRLKKKITDKSNSHAVLIGLDKITAKSSKNFGKLRRN